MSRLILKGETVKNFGEFLPAPHIERVYVYDEKITVELSLMLTLTEDEDEEALLERLSGLKTYLYLTTEAEEQVQGDAVVLNKDDGAGRSVFTLIASVEATDDFTNHDYAIIDFSEFESIGEYLYDTSGNKVLKLIATVKTTSAESYSAGLFGYLILLDLADGDETELTLYAFSSMLSVEEGSNMARAPDSSGGPTLLDQNTSDVAYETIFEDGEIVGQPEMIWMTTPARQPFDGIPLQAIASAKYYTPDHITHKEITESFNELLEEVEGNAKAKSDTVLESVTDSVSYVLGIYGTAPDLLPRLDVLRKAWPDKSSATHTGRLYKKFKGKLHKANLAVARGTLLHKELVLNPKIIDAREYDEEYVDGAIAEIEDEDILYDRWRIDLTAVSSAGAEEIDEAFGGGYISDHLQASGFLYFDYEKLLHTASNIAAFFDTEKIDNFFGTELLGSHLKVSRAMFGRFTLEDEDDEFGVANRQVYLSTTVTDGVAEESQVGWTSPYDETYAPYLDLIDGTTEYSYLRSRNFAFADDEVNSYRLMTFEFQDIWQMPYSYSEISTFLEEGKGPRDLMYWGKVYVEDNTVDVVKALTSSYYSYYTGSLQEYYDMAAEYCSYNDVDEKFNKFYIDAVMAAHADNMEEAPWIRLPVVYNMHSDLLFGRFDGDVAAIIDASKKLSDQINPYAGNLERLENFKEKFERLYDDYYAAGNIPAMMAGSWDTDYFFTTEYRDLPLIYDESLEAQVTAAELSAQAVTEFGNWLALFEIAQTTWQDECSDAYTDISNQLDALADYSVDDCLASEEDTWYKMGLYGLSLELLLDSYSEEVASFRDVFNLFLGSYVSGAGWLSDSRGYLYEADTAGLVEWGSQAVEGSIGAYFYDAQIARVQAPVAAEEYIWAMGSADDHGDVYVSAGGWSSWKGSFTEGTISSDQEQASYLKCEASADNLTDNVTDVRDGIKSAYADINDAWTAIILILEEALELYEETAAKFE